MEVDDTADFVEVDDTAATNLGGRHGLGFDPAPHYVFRDVLQAQHLSEYCLGAERSGTEVRDLSIAPVTVNPTIPDSSMVLPYN